MHVDKISEAMDVHKKNLPSDLPMHVDKISGRGSDTKEPCPLPTHTSICLKTKGELEAAYSL